jgi:hypothetical protein
MTTMVLKLADGLRSGDESTIADIADHEAEITEPSRPDVS